MKNVAQGLVFIPFILVGCPQPDPEPSNVECEQSNDCGEQTQPPCAGCLPIAIEMCLLGTCTVLQEAAVDVSVDVMLQRGDMTSQTTSLVYAVATQQGGSTSYSCQDAFLSAGEPAEDLNVLAAGYKSVSGGSFHDDIGLGRLPEALVLVLIWGTTEIGGQGDWTGQGCLALDLTEQTTEDPIITLE